MTEKHHYEVNHVPIPVPMPHEIVVRNLLVGVNPVDWKSVEYGFGIHGYPWINGRESVGVVVTIGDAVKKFGVGSRVLLVSTNYRDLRTSTFQEFTVCPEHLAADVGGMDFSEAIGYGVPLISAYVALDGLKAGSGTVLIWGGASCTGVFLLQLAKRKGLRVVSIASERSHTYVKSFGADLVLNRNKILTAEDILSAITEPIVYAIDCIGKESASLVLQALELCKHSDHFIPQMVCLNASLHSDTVSVRSLNLKKVHENEDYGRQVTLKIEQLIHELKPPKIHCYSGLENIPSGLGHVKQGHLGKTVVGIEYVDYSSHAHYHK